MLGDIGGGGAAASIEGHRPSVRATGGGDRGGVVDALTAGSARDAPGLSPAARLTPGGTSPRAPLRSGPARGGVPAAPATPEPP